MSWAGRIKTKIFKMLGRVSKQVNGLAREIERKNRKIERLAWMDRKINGPTGQI